MAALYLYRDFLRALQLCPNEPSKKPPNSLLGFTGIKVSRIAELMSNGKTTVNVILHTDKNRRKASQGAENTVSSHDDYFSMDLISFTNKKGKQLQTEWNQQAEHNGLRSKAQRNQSKRVTDICVLWVWVSTIRKRGKSGIKLERITTLHRRFCLWLC